MVFQSPLEYDEVYHVYDHGDSQALSHVLSISKLARNDWELKIMCKSKVIHCSEKYSTLLENTKFTRAIGYQGMAILSNLLEILLI